MKTKIFSFAVLLLIASCSQEEQQITKVESSKFEKVGITKIELISPSNQIFNSLTKTDYYKNLDKSFGDIDFTKTEFMTLTTKNINFIKIYFKNINLTMLAIYDNNKSEFLNAYIHEYKVENSKEIVNQYSTNGRKYLNLVSNSETKAIESIVTFDSPQGRTQTWSNCMKTAFNACSADWQCAILCGLAFPECIGATALACAIVQL